MMKVSKTKPKYVNEKFRTWFVTERPDQDTKVLTNKSLNCNSRLATQNIMIA